MMATIEDLQAKVPQFSFADWDELVHDVADGHATADDAEDRAERLGKTVPELLAEVQRLKKRRSLGETSEIGEEASVEHAAIGQEIAAENQRFAALRDEHDHRIYALMAKQHEAMQLITEGATARADLQRSCTDPRLQNDLWRLGQQMKANTDKQSQITGTISSLRSVHSDAFSRGDNDRANDAQNRIDTLTHELSGLRTASTVLLTRRQELESAQLDPERL